MGAPTIFEPVRTPITTHIPPLIRTCALLIFVGTPIVVRAETPVLTVKPQVCALAEQESVCREQLHIQWRAEKPMHLCLFVDSETTPLTCWREQNSGAYYYQAHTQHSLVFQLRQQPDQQMLTSEMFSVIREQTEYRQRRRKPWNFF